MYLFLKAHRAHHGALAAAVLALVGWWLAGRVLPLPQLLQGHSQPVAVSLLLAAGLAPVVSRTFGGATLGLEYSARRALWVHDLTLLGVVMVPAAAVTLVSAAAGDLDFAGVALRDAAAFTGLALLALAAAGETAAAVAPIGYFLLMATLGGRPDGTAQWWAAWRGPVDPVTVAAAAVLLTVGVLAYHYGARRRSVTR